MGSIEKIRDEVTLRVGSNRSLADNMTIGNLDFTFAHPFQ
jgi:hypothetical protein